MHLPLRSVVMDRVTGGAVRGYLHPERERKNSNVRKGSRDRVMGKRERERK